MAWTDLCDLQVINIQERRYSHFAKHCSELPVVFLDDELLCTSQVNEGLIRQRILQRLKHTSEEASSRLLSVTEDSQKPT